MRIGCAACGHTHDSDVTPFSHNVVRDGFSQSEEVPVLDPESGETVEMIHYNKDAESGFSCGHCGTTNTVHVKWTAVRPKKEVESEST